LGGALLCCGDLDGGFDRSRVRSVGLGTILIVSHRLIGGVYGKPTSLRGTPVR